MTRKVYNGKQLDYTAYEHNLAIDLKRFYGITIADYDKLYQQQNGLCAVCGKPEVSRNRHGVRRLSVDHNHDTKKVRALLCNRCNILVGKFEREKELLGQILTYFVEHENFSF